MEENGMWGYEDIYGPVKPVYHEDFDKPMKDALNYMCARVKRSGDFWNALRTAASMYSVNENDLRINFEKRKKAGIERKMQQRRANEKWFAVRYSYGDEFNDEKAGWMFLKAADPEIAMQTASKRRKKQDCKISIQKCIPFQTREEADIFAVSWEKEHKIRQLPLWDFA